MAIRMPKIMHAKHILRQSKLFLDQAASALTDVSKGYFAVYWGKPKEEIYSSNFITESAFVSEVVKYSRGRIRIQSSNGWLNNSLQRRGLRSSHFKLALVTY